jgi:protein-disulfide isomerase
VDANGLFYRGSLDAPVTLIEFSDFECPFCARHSTEVGPLIDEAYVATGKVLHYFRFFPIPELGHVNAVAASQATYCAGMQSADYFWAMHDWLFASQAEWAGRQDGAAIFREHALSLGVEGGAYDACLTAQSTTDAIARDKSDAMAMGVTGTPAFFVNDWFVTGAQPFSEFEAAIAKATQGLHPAPTPTPLPQGVEFYDADPSRSGLTYDGSPTLGDANAKVVVIAYEDFSVAEVAANSAAEPALRSKYIDAGLVRWVVAYFPISDPRAAVAGVCAARQDRFWDYRSALFERRESWVDGGDASLLTVAKEAGLNSGDFEKCLADEQAQAQVDYSLNFATSSIGVPTSPSYLILKLDDNGQVVDGTGTTGAQSLEQFEAALDGLLNPPEPTPTPTVAPRSELPELETGITAEGLFYRGNPNALVRLTEYSDFQ